MSVIKNDWDVLLGSDFESDNMKNLSHFLRSEYALSSVLPDKKDIFRAFYLTPPEKVKVVILGQDPYPNRVNATGLAFSVSPTTPLPLSLQNIYKEMKDDLGVEPPKTGDLTFWAEQGVLLLNAVLTVREGESGSHRGKGWELFTDAAIKKISEYKPNLVFILWGAYARAKKCLIAPDMGHLIIESSHPSPFSARSGFFGSRPFSRTNNFLIQHGQSPINWSEPI